MAQTQRQPTPKAVRRRRIVRNVVKREEDDADVEADIDKNEDEARSSRIKPIKAKSKGKEKLPSRVPSGQKRKSGGVPDQENIAKARKRAKKVTQDASRDKEKDIDSSGPGKDTLGETIYEQVVRDQQRVDTVQRQLDQLST